MTRQEEAEARAALVAVIRQHSDLNDPKVDPILKTNLMKQPLDVLKGLAARLGQQKGRKQHGPS